MSALFQYSARGADLHLADRFIDTPQFAEEDNMWHLEAAIVWGVWGGSGGWGAWQIAGRYDVLDLSDKAEDMNLAYNCVECGEQQTWLFGLNWLLTDYTALKLQVSQSHITGGNNFPRGERRGFNRNDGADITGAGVRWQVDW